jgi:16S rRNA (guanine966-N2)-methyltransferase
VRPTADRVKESVFAALGARLESARVLDLYAGTGALAVEALSRGAALAVVVERDRDALAAIVTNLEAMGMATRAEVVRGDVAAVLDGPPPAGGPFDLILADPPYDLADEALTHVLERLRAGWLAPGALVVIERPAGAARPPGWVSTWERCYGDTLVWFLQAE